MSKKDHKTNAMRILDQEHVAYESIFLEGVVDSALHVAELVGEEPGRIFKTLVTVGQSGQHFVFMVPSDRELDLKKAARAAGEKTIRLTPINGLFALTGYIHGGCSPIGMKKAFATFIDQSASDHEDIYFSGGRPGCQIKMSVTALAAVVGLESADIAAPTTLR